VSTAVATSSLFGIEVPSFLFETSEEDNYFLLKMRKNVDPSAMLLPSIQKDIAFVIPPSKPPSTTLYGPATLRGYGDDRNTSSREEKPAPKEEGVVNRGWNFLGGLSSLLSVGKSDDTGDSADVISATSTLKSSPKARSRDSLPMQHLNNNSLDIPTIKTSDDSFDECPIQIMVDGEENSDDRSASLVVTSLGLPIVQNATPTDDLSAPNSRRGSATTIGSGYLGPQGESRKSRDNSRRGSVLDLLNAPNQGFMTASAPGSHCGSRRGSNAGIFIEPEQNPESYAKFGGINPSLYLNPEQFDKEEDFPEDHLGRVYYSIYYDEIDEALNIYINRIRNLPKSTPQAGKTNKTYIKICLLPDERSERKCTQHADTFAELNPSFSENIVFQVSPCALWGRTLRILVFNIDVNRKHRIVGQTLLDLADVDLSQGKLNLTADLQKFVNLNDLPELLLSVCYNATLLRLTVNVVEGKNFKSVNSENTPDIYVKLALMNQTKEVKRKKTQIIKKNINPAFQESFNFKADENDIETIGVRVTAMQHMPFPEKDKPLGFTVMGGFMFARGVGREHWDEVMKNQKTHIQKWHKLQEGLAYSLINMV